MAFSNEDLAVVMARTHDPGRGPFCDVDKQGNRVNKPPREVDPIQDRETNPRGTRHIRKTEQDYMRPEDRPRVKEAQRQAELRRQGK